MSNSLSASISVANTDGENLSPPKHLVVVSHGLMGTAYDLTRLSQFLEQGRSPGCSVLLSKSNEFTKSLRGIEMGAISLVDEIIDFLKEMDSKGVSYAYISFVGNSLGGLFTRYAIKLLFNRRDFLNRNILPNKFLTIATPHLGVYHYNFLETHGIQIPGDDYLKKVVGNLFFSSGNDLFAKGYSSLLYQMATNEEFLIPLRQFKQRRLYANLRRDSVVPLGTAAFLPKGQVKVLKAKYHGKSGFVYSTITDSSSSSLQHHHHQQQQHTEQNPSSLSSSSSNFDSISNTSSCKPSSNQTNSSCSSSNNNSSSHHTTSTNILSLPSTEIADEPYLIEMILSLDSLGWEKFVVNFPGGWYPLAHNKLCALTRQPSWFYEKVLGFDEGLFVMKHAADWMMDSSNTVDDTTTATAIHT